MKDSPAFLTASEMHGAVASGELSPVDLVTACLERVERYDGTLNALCTVSDRAIDDAHQLEDRLKRGEEPGPLCGVPVGIKDTTDVAGLRTTYGSPLFADHVPERDALVVERLRAAGAIVMGKTNVPEFAAGGNTYNEIFGRTRNPWNPELTAGGSTGGGAAALAACMVGLAQGSDLGGSLRMPASFCGVVGLRPSPGVVPSEPSSFLFDTLSVNGPMGRTAEDVARMLQVLAGPAPSVPVVQPAPESDVVERVRRGLRIGARLAYCPDLARIGIDPQISEVCRAAAIGLGDVGAEVEEVELDLSAGRDAFLALRGLWMVCKHRDRLDRLDDLGENVRGNIEAGLRVTTAEVARGVAVQVEIVRRLFELFERFDHLLTPTVAVPPFPVEENYPKTVGGREMETYVDWFAPTFLLSLTGLPVASVPCGLDEQGLPVGLQVVGRPRHDAAVLAVARTTQELCPVGLPRL